MKEKVFISYAKEDYQKAEQIYNDLRKKNIKPWMDKKDLKPGSRWKLEITKSIKECEYFLFLLSEYSVSKRGFVQKELKIALDSLDEFGTNETFIIPVRLDECEVIDEKLASLHRVDLFPFYEQGINKIIREISGDNTSSDDTQSDNSAILIIGSGLAENILSIDTTIEYQNKYIELNKKYIAKRRELFLGGSGINFSIRLAKTNHLILPILSMGKDEFGFKAKKILSNILINNIKNNSIINFIESEDFLCDQLVSSNTTVISSNNTRTTFTPELKGIEHFSNFVDNRLDRVSKLNNIKIKAIMIGHIYADHPKYQNEGIITKRIIQKFKEKSFIFANFGESQLNSGLTFWKNHLKDVSVIQFSLPEVKQFFSEKGKNVSLSKIIEWFIINNVNVVITHDKFGFIAVFNKGYLKGKVIYGESPGLKNVVDTTGAGDSFASGLVSSLYKNTNISSDDFLYALNIGRLWAAYACTIFGSSIHSPDNKELEDFKKTKMDDLKEIQLLMLEDVKTTMILNLFDKH